MAFHGLRSKMKKIEIVRDNTTNKNLTNVVVARVKTMIERFVSPRASRSPTTLNIESTMYNPNTYRCPRRPRPNLPIDRASQFNQVVDDLERTIDNDPPEGNVYDLPRHVRASAALKDINARLNDLEASKRITNHLVLLLTYNTKNSKNSFEVSPPVLVLPPHPRYPQPPHLGPQTHDFSLPAVRVRDHLHGGGRVSYPKTPLPRVQQRTTQGLSGA